MNTAGKIWVAIGALLAVGVAGAIVYTFIQNNPPVPVFSYNPSGIVGWYESQNSNQQKLAKSLGSNYRGDEPVDKLPIADLTIHHGEKGAEKAPDDNCFVAFSYYDYTLDNVEAAYTSYEDRKKEQGELVVLEPLKRSVATFEGDKEYELQQYSYTIEGQDVLSGYEVGFFNLVSGHMRIEGVCKTSGNLGLTLPILEAVTLNEN